MFWQENQMTSSSINTLLEIKSVSLADLLNDEDILQECKSLNKQLVEFLLRPNTIYELIQLIVEEPPCNVDLRQRYRHSAMASEIIASRVPNLSETIAGDPKLLGKLYSFLDSKPPLNPLLASFFAKTIEVLFTHSAAHQDWYTYQFMCLQVIEYFKSCPDFLPKILQHIGTSGIMNSLQYITQVTVDDMKNITLNWLDSQNLVEKLIELICGTYVPTYCAPAVTVIATEAPDVSNTCETGDNNDSQNITKPEEEPHETPEKLSEATTDTNVGIENPNTSEAPIDNVEIEKAKASEPPIDNAEIEKSYTQEPQINTSESVTNGPVEGQVSENPTDSVPEKLNERLLSSRSANASQLMCNFISKGREPNTEIGFKFYNPLLAKCLSAEIINKLLESVFSSPENTRKNSLVNGVHVLLTLLNDESGQTQQVEIHRIAEVIAPWIPKFVEVLKIPSLDSKVHSDVINKPVGVARLSLAQLFVVLVETDSPAVFNAMIEHQVFNLLLDMFFEYEFNNFLHASVEGVIEKAFNAPSQKEFYKTHLLSECSLIQRIYDAWEKADTPGSQRPGYMGHLIQIANRVQDCLNTTQTEESNPIPQKEQWDQVVEKLNKINAICATVLECYNTEYLHDVNFNDGDDILGDTMNELPENSEQLFSSMCENTASSLGDNNSTDDWTHANIKNITGDCTLEETHSENIAKAGVPLGNIDSAYFDLLTNFKDDAMNVFNKWLMIGGTNCPDWIDNIDDNTIAVPLPNTTDSTSSPWGEVPNISDDQSGWADFASFQETAGISTVPNTFTCEAFASFDQKAVSKGESQAQPTVPPFMETGTLLQEKLHVEILNTETESKENSACSTINPDAVRLEQIQSDTSINNMVITTGEDIQTFADVVNQQPGAQKLVVSQQDTKELDSAEEPSQASVAVKIEDHTSSPETPGSSDVNALTESLTKISVEAFSANLPSESDSSDVASVTVESDKNIDKPPSDNSDQNTKLELEKADKQSGTDNKTVDGQR